MNVAFLANTYHLTRTKSSQFFIDLLQGWFGSVTVVAHQDVWARLPGTSWDLLVAWQHLFSPEELEAFGARTSVLVPMYDDCPLDEAFWVRYRGFKVLCFSSTLGARLTGWGLDCLSVTYWPPVPATQASWSGGLRGFFWPRTDRLDGRQVGILARGTHWEAFHLHGAHTPATAVLLDETSLDVGAFHRSDWFEGAGDYAQAVAQANVFFAPRRIEGIGMANLEALALGMAVVAADVPTANEYIVSGTNGILFDPEAPQPLDFTAAEAWGRAAREHALAGRSRWLASLPGIRGFLEAPGSAVRRRPHPWLTLKGRGLALARTVYRSLKRTMKRGNE